MTVLYYILHRLLPGQLTHPGLELAHRRQTQHVLVFLLALCTLVLNGQVGQAGIGAIHQVQVSNYTAVPPYAVIAQPQLLLLVLDQHLNSPSLQVVGHNRFHRDAQVVRNQSNILSLVPPTREYHLDHTEFVQSTEAFGQAIHPLRAESSNRGPLSAAPQDIPAIGAEFVLPAVDEKVAIRLAYAHKMEPARPAGIGDDRTEIVRIEQNRRCDALRQDNVPDRLGGQFCQRPERYAEFRGVFFLEVQPRPPRDSHAAIPKADFQNRMAGAVLACGMVEQLTYASHFLGVLERLGVINDEIALAAVFPMQPTEGVQGDLLNDGRFVPAASPEELSVVGSMGRASQEFAKAFDGAAMCDGDGHNQPAKVLPGGAGKVFFQGVEKGLSFSRDSTDGNHAAAPSISNFYHNPYRRNPPLFFRFTYHHRIPNRSV